MSKMRGVVQILASVLALMAGALLLNTGLLRSLGEHRQQAVLRAIGFPDRFVVGASLVENLLLVGLGAALGVGLASVGGMGASAVLADYLPYAPSGNLVSVSAVLGGQVMLGSAVLAGVATLPAWIRLRFFTELSALRGA
jgi:predicted lysophospholipase L1 biosynthesis ABC-type transport system permease subunit